MFQKFTSLNSATCLCEKAEKMLLPVRFAFLDSRVDALFGASSAGAAAAGAAINFVKRNSYKIEFYSYYPPCEVGETIIF